LTPQELEIIEILHTVTFSEQLKTAGFNAMPKVQMRDLIFHFLEVSFEKVFRFNHARALDHPGVRASSR
jgi:hypothetical protein